MRVPFALFLPVPFLCELDSDAIEYEETIEARAAADPPSAVRYAEWLAVWERCIRLEKEFWDMAMDPPRTRQSLARL